MKPKKSLSLSVKAALMAGFLWFALTVLTLFFDRELTAALWILLGLWEIILLLAGIAVALWVFVLLVSERKAAVPALVPLVIGFAFLGIWNYGGAARGEQMRFEMQRGSYEAALARIEHDKMPASGEVDGLSYRRDETLPQRVSFIEEGGMLDNYTAIIYDPSDTVLLANQFKGDWSNFNDPKLRHIKKLFGGDMIWATPLGKHWYRCGFT